MPTADRMYSRRPPHPMPPRRPAPDQDAEQPPVSARAATPSETTGEGILRVAAEVALGETVGLAAAGLTALPFLVTCMLGHRGGNR
jgi:hypothetical protein